MLGQNVRSDVSGVYTIHLTNRTDVFKMNSSLSGELFRHLTVSVHYAPLWLHLQEHKKTVTTLT
jgi:hypothetical protein